MFAKFKNKQIDAKTINKINKIFGSVEKAFQTYSIEYEQDLFPLFKKICFDSKLQKKIGDKKYLSLLNKIRAEFLDEGEFGETWLTGQHIYNTMQTLEKKNNNFCFLGLISFDCNIMFDSIINKFEQKIKKGKKQFAIIQNHFFVKNQDKGTHWVTIFIDLEQNFIFYFDSNGEKQSDKFRQSSNDQKMKNPLFTQYYEYFIQKMIGKTLSLKIPQNKTLEDVIFDNNKNDKIAKGKFKNMYIFFNRKQHQYKDGNCGTYAIFFNYLLSNYLKRMNIHQLCKILEKQKIKDSIIEKFKTKIFVQLPQIIDIQNISQVKQSLKKKRF